MAKLIYSEDYHIGLGELDILPNLLLPFTNKWWQDLGIGREI